MSTHNICFRGEIRKILCGYPLLSVPMQICKLPRPSSFSAIITKTRLYNFDPLKPHFYTVKLGFTGVYNIFLISAQNI